MLLVKSPSILQPLSRDLLWKIDTVERDIYLTFDDGPTAKITNDTLDILQSYNAVATFFCLGKNVALNPDIYIRIKDEGHAIGNHTFDHPDGWKTSTMSYGKNVLEAKKYIDSCLFRPPYGRITPSQITLLKNKFTIVMWHIISGDYDKNISQKKCVKNVTTHAEKGSIIVFHDSLKAAKNMLFALPKCLQFFQNEGYSFRTIQ